MHEPTGNAVEVPELALRVFQRILVPVDFSDESRAAIRMALELKRRLGSQVCLFNLTTVGTDADFRRGLGNSISTGDLEIDGKARLRTLVETLAPGEGDEVALQVYVGEDVARWVHDAATAWPATMVILAAHASHTVLRSLTEKIMRALKVPLLILQ